MENNIIQVDNLSFSYGEKVVLNNCSFSVAENTITVLLGSNGAGKSTLFACLMKHLKTDDFSIQINSIPLSQITLKKLSQLMSYVPQINMVNDLDCIVRDYLVEGRTPYMGTFAIPGKKEYLLAEKYARTVEISHLLGKNIQHLSGGELQLVLITRALVQETPIILMDEPMSALDLGNQIKLLKLIEYLKSQGKTIFFSSHNPNHALALNGNVCLLKEGRMIVAGPASESINKENLSVLYGEGVMCGNVNGSNICYLALK